MAGPEDCAGAAEGVPLGFLDPPGRPDALGRIGHYEVLQVLGRGGFGIVFRAFDTVLHRVVAVKVLSPLMAAASPARKRFLREARAAAAVRHDNVVQVYKVGEQPLPYLVMEFIPGETLQQRLDRVGPVEPAEVARVGRQIAEGLAAAHANDLIHRDIKPGNVLLEGVQQKVKLTDFGLARAADDASITRSGVVVGTPMYMAPEQAKGERLDQRADLFSLGSVLYQMATGRPPFRAGNTVAVLKRVAEDDPRPIREVIPETPQWLCDVIARLHAKDPDGRFQSAREVADVLADCEARLRAHARPKDFPRIPRGPSRPSGRRTRLAAVAVVVTLAVLVPAATELAGVTHWFRGEAPPGPGHADDAPPRPVEAPQAELPPALRLVFDHPLTKDDTLQFFNVARGQHQYISEVKVLREAGLVLDGGHTTSVVWPKVYLGDWYRVQFEARVPEDMPVGFTLGGPGYGNSLATGYFCRFDKTSFGLCREDRQVSSTPIPRPFRAGDWVAVAAEARAGELTVTLDGMPVLNYADNAPLTGPLHGWFGLAGGTSNAQKSDLARVAYRNLRVWSSATETRREPAFTPPVTAKPLPNGKLLYEFKPGDFDAEWFKTQPDNAGMEQGAIVLSGENNGRPELVLDKPLPPTNLACEVEFEYPIHVLNFGISLLHAARPPRCSKDCDGGWQVQFPVGIGCTQVRWHRVRDDDYKNELHTEFPEIASTPFYAPIAGRKYLARVETGGDSFRVFLDGGVLLTAKRPADAAASDLPTFLRLGQIYGGSKVHAVRVYQLAP
jgi:serine/threonine protein kinase